MKNSEVLILQGLRNEASRLPNKPSAIVGNETLMERGFRLMNEVRRRTGVALLVAAPKEDTDIYEAGAKAGIEVMPSISSNSWETAFGHLRDPLLKRGIKAIIDSNFVCRPFLTAETIERIIQTTAEKGIERPLCGVIKKNAIVWDGQGNIIHGAGETTDGISNPIVQLPGHLAYVLDATILGKEDQLTDPTLIDFGMEWYEANHDIDTPADVQKASITYAGLQALREQYPELIRRIFEFDKHAA